jgi:hypothetical protein
MGVLPIIFYREGSASEKHGLPAPSHPSESAQRTSAKGAQASAASFIDSLMSFC